MAMVVVVTIVGTVVGGSVGSGPTSGTVTVVVGGAWWIDGSVVVVLDAVARGKPPASGDRPGEGLPPLLDPLFGGAPSPLFGAGSADGLLKPLAPPNSLPR